MFFETHWGFVTKLCADGLCLLREILLETGGLFAYRDPTIFSHIDPESPRQCLIQPVAHPQLVSQSE